MRLSRWIIAGTGTGLLLGAFIWLPQFIRPASSPPPRVLTHEEAVRRADEANARALKELQARPNTADTTFEAPRGAPTVPYVNLTAQGPGTDTPGADADKDGLWDDAQAQLASTRRSVPVTARQTLKVTRVLQRALITAQKPGALSLNDAGEVEPRDPARKEVLALRRELQALEPCRLMRGPDLMPVDTFDLARQALSTSPARRYQMEAAWQMLAVSEHANVSNRSCPDLNVMQNPAEERWNAQRIEEFKKRPVPTEPPRSGPPLLPDAGKNSPTAP